MVKKIGICFVICFLMIAAVIPAYGALKDGPDASTMALYYRNADAVLSIIDVNDWLVSNASVSTFVSKSVSVEKGYKYRAKASCYAYAGSKSEHVTKYSAEVSY